MPSWIPVPGTSKERLVRAALREFGARGYDDVSVGELAEQAGVTIGSLYHHFGSKQGIYELVRTDVERRVNDRMEGAAAVREATTASITPVLLVGFDYVVGSGYARMLGEPHPADAQSVAADPVADVFHRLADREEAPIGILLLAAWRAALLLATEGEVSAARARTALAGLSSL